MPPLHRPLAHDAPTLNWAGVVGFFGGDEAISAMATVHLYRGRRWLGWFNSPGGYTVAKCFGRMANARFWGALFPGPRDSPTVTFGLDGKPGPEYIAAMSGTRMKTGHLAYLTMERSRSAEAKLLGGRQSTPIDVSYLTMNRVKHDSPLEYLPLLDVLLAFIPISVSVTACIMCALVYDWLSFSLILLGIISSGLASCIIGRGRLVIKPVKPPSGVPPGHGILITDHEVVVIKGAERDVNVITKGSFGLEKGPVRGGRWKGTILNGDIEKGAGSKEGGGQGNGTSGNATAPKQGGDEVAAPHYHGIGFCSLLLAVQFLAQLFAISQGTLFGQVMFVISLFVSWGYNSYLSALEKEKLQADLLFRMLGNPEMRRFRAGSRTAMAVFVCLLLFHGIDELSPEDGRAFRGRILKSCLPNDTVVWERWMAMVTRQLMELDDRPKLRCLERDEDMKLSEKDSELLDQLLNDARTAFDAYFDVCDELPEILLPRELKH